MSVARADTAVRRGAGGAVYLRSRHELGPYPDRLTERLAHWADRAPERVFLAQRTASGEWRTLTYAETLAAVRRVAQALLARRLSAGRPVVILSGNGIEHALLALASMHCGIPYTPLATAYSLQAREYGMLREILTRLEPGLVFAAEGALYERALGAVVPGETELVVSASAPEARRATPFAELAASVATGAVDDAHRATGPDTIAKILYTSGSTGRPKGVVNTQRMLCSNQAMLESVFPFLTEEPPVLCDWLPWNHTAGGNHNFGIVLYHGGTLYIDEGRPLPGAFDATVRNLREVSATAHFTVPRTYELLLPYLRSDRALRERFFARLKLLFYAAAGLTQRMFDELTAMAVETCGCELLWVTGMGATETAPFALCTGRAGAWAGFVGFPVPGLELKLAPEGEKLEARVRGPNVAPGYWRDPALTGAAFDDEGFYRLGDAMRFVDPDDPARGLVFDGRLAEDFKLSTGTWVHVGPLRARIVASGAGLVEDAAIAGHDRGFVAALVFPSLARCRELCPDLGDAAPLQRPARRSPRDPALPPGAGGGRRAEHGQLDARRARGPARHAAVLRRARADRQGHSEPEGRAREPLRVGGRALCGAPAVPRDRPLKVAMNQPSQTPPPALDVERLAAIDVHVHLHSPGDRGAADEAARKYFGSDADPDWEAIARYYRERRMACVVFTVDERLSGRTPVANEAVLDFAARHADVALAFVSLDPTRGNEAASEARRLIARGGVRGLKLHPPLQQFFPNERVAYPLYEVFAEARLPVVFHTGHSGIGSGMRGGGGVRLKYGSPLPIDDVAVDFPDMPIVMAHPSFPWQEEAISICLHKPQVYIDLSGWSPKYFPPTLVQYANTLLKSKVLFGSDYPLLTPDRWLAEFDKLELKPEVRPLILKQNAVRLLGL